MTGGTSSARTSSPLLFLHGALGSAAQMLPLARAFRDERPVLVPDVTGHGPLPAGGEAAADRPEAGVRDGEGFSIPRFADDVRAFLGRQRSGPVDIFGYSMGGYVALYLARHHPGLVGAIVTLGTKFAWEPRAAEKEAARLDPSVIEAKVPAFAALLRERHGEEWPRVVRSTAEMMRALGASPDLTADDFRSIPHRVLVAVGDRDTMVSADETTVTAGMLPAGEHLVLPGVPHPLEQVDHGLIAHHARNFFTQGQSA
jgi:pimeloyl-ACP methyl ester carboxylesterase